MIISEDKQRAELRGAKHKQAYTLQASAAVFDAMFQKLYADPIGSVVREIYTNAMEVTPPGGPHPVVSLPSYLSHSFSVRDFGPGMSRDFVLSTYTVGGASTKRDSNEMIGGFGFGAKSGFAYSDSFTVTSWHGGVKTIYLMHRDENRIPTVAIVSEKPSDEPSGIEFKLATRLEDQSRWREAAGRQLYGMPIRPDFGKDFPWPAIPSFLLSHPDNDVHLLDSALAFNQWVGEEGKVFIRMGGPVYELTQTQVRMCQATGFMWIDAPIGAVDLTPSRENLNFSQKTISFIKSMEQKLGSIIKSECEQKLFSCKTFWEAIGTYEEITGSGKNRITVRYCPRHWKHPVHGRTYTISDTHLELTNFKYKNIITPPPPAPSFQQDAIKCVKVADNTLRLSRFIEGGRIRYNRSYKSIYVVAPDDKRWMSRIGYDQEQTPGPFLVLHYPDSDIWTLWSEHEKALDGAPFRMVSSLPVAPRPKGVALNNHYRTFRFHSDTNISFSKSTTLAHKDGGVFIVFSELASGTRLTFKDEVPTVAATSAQLQALSTFWNAFRIGHVAVIPKSHYKAFSGDKAKWISLHDKIQHILDNDTRRYLALPESYADIAETAHNILPPHAYIPACLEKLHLRIGVLVAKLSPFIIKYKQVHSQMNNWQQILKDAVTLDLKPPAQAAVPPDPEWDKLLKLHGEIISDPEYSRYYRYSKVSPYSRAETNEILKLFV